MLALFKRVLVLRGGTAAVDRFEGLLLVARGRGYAGGAGLSGKGILLNMFEEQLRFFVLGPYNFRRIFEASELVGSFFECRVFPIIRVQRGNNPRRALTGIKAEEPGDQPFRPLRRAIGAGSIGGQPPGVSGDRFWRHPTHHT